MSVVEAATKFDSDGVLYKVGDTVSHRDDEWSWGKIESFLIPPTTEGDTLVLWDEERSDDCGRVVKLDWIKHRSAPKPWDGEEREGVFCEICEDGIEVVGTYHEDYDGDKRWLCAKHLAKVKKEDARAAALDDRFDDARDGYSIDFADPGGRSALRAETGGSSEVCNARGGCGKPVSPDHNFCPWCGKQLNPRIYPCPDCGREYVLTREDKERGYRCDICADVAEGLRPGWGY